MFLCDFIDNIYLLGGDMGSEIEIVDTEGNTLTLDQCRIERDDCNVVILHTGEY